MSVNTQNRNRLIDTENRLTVARGGALGVRVKKVKGSRGTEVQLQKSRRKVKYGIGNIVGNVVITAYSAGWAPETSGEPFVGVWLSNHCAVPLKLIQNNIKYKLYLKKNTFDSLKK